MWSTCLQADFPHIYLHLIFEISSTRNWFLNLIFCLFRTGFLQTIQAVKILFEIDKKSKQKLSSWTRDFKNQAQIDRGSVNCDSSQGNSQNECYLYSRWHLFSFKMITIFILDDNYFYSRWQFLTNLSENNCHLNLLSLDNSYFLINHLIQ